MLRFIRHKAPFIMLGYSALFAIASYYELYYGFYSILPDLLGFSIFTNLFMLSLYWNKCYCDATKIAVGGLLCLNGYNLLSINETFLNYSPIYDIYIIGITVFILFALKFQNR